MGAREARLEAFHPRLTLSMDAMPAVDIVVPVYNAPGDVARCVESVLAHTGPEHRLVLIDFGSAWPVERTLKREPSDGITAPYAAPEQLEGNGFVDWRADVFGLTVVWYELMTLQIPYDGMGGRAGLAEYRDDFAKTFIPPSHLSPNAEQIPASVWRLIDDAVERGLALRADDRFADRGSWLKAMNGIQNAIHDPPSISSWDRRWLAWLDWFSLPKKK